MSLIAWKWTSQILKRRHLTKLSSWTYLTSLTPYFDREERRLRTSPRSNFPRTSLYCTPGRSFARPPRTRTFACLLNVWPSPGMYADIMWRSAPPRITRTRAVSRRAELGLRGVRSRITSTPPRRWGLPRRILRREGRNLSQRCLFKSWVKVATTSFVFPAWIDQDSKEHIVFFVHVTGIFRRHDMDLFFLQPKDCMIEFDML